MIKEEKNILISSAGRRVELINAWKSSVKKILGENSKIYANDMKMELSSACYFADESFNICGIDNKDYIEELLKKCIQNNIKIIIPTIDTELNLLSKNREKFKEHNIHIIISEYDFILKCQNKKITKDFFNKLGIDSPRIFDSKSIKFPCFMKPINGSSSEGVKFITNDNQISNYEKSNKEIIFQEMVPKDWIEYSVDIYFDKFGYLKSCVPRQRISTRGGEINRGITRRDEVFKFIIEKVSHLKGARGVITFQLFTNPSRDKFLAIEINPRFGGGYPMSHYSGVDFPSMLIREYLLNQEISFQDDWEQDLLMLRYDSMISIKNKS